MKATRLLIVCAILFAPGILIASEHFDGTWHTKVTCPPTGNTEGFTWKFDSVVQNGNLRGVHGTEGQPASFVLEGKIADDGSAKLTGTGIINSREYARGVFVHKGEQYTWDVKAQFKDTDGTGLRNEGLGIVGRPCTFDFVKQQAATQPGVQ
jgi:hypothetical protein